MNTFMKELTLVLGLAAVLGLTAMPASAGGGHEAKKHSKEMMSEAEEMVSHGGAGHMDVMIKHAKSTIMHAEGAIKSLPDGNPHSKEAKMHISMAISEAEEAINHGGQGHGSVAMKHAKSSLKHAKEGDMHVQEIK